MKSCSTKEIKQHLIESCITLNAFHFLPYLLSPIVEVDFPNKIRFYRFLKNVLEAAKEESEGALQLKIEHETWEEDEELFAYNFYDENHKFPRITLQVKENGNSIFIDLQPF